METNKPLPITDEVPRLLFEGDTIRLLRRYEKQECSSSFVCQELNKLAVERVAPTIAVLKQQVEDWQGEAYKVAEECGSTCGKEIEELKQQLSAERDNSRENAIGFADWLVWNNYVPFGLPLRKENLFHKQGDGTRVNLSELYSLYLTSLTKQSEGK